MPIDKWDISGLIPDKEITASLAAIRQNRKLDFTVVVTGAAGSIGSALCLCLLRSGVHRLVLIDHAETPMFHLLQRIKNEDSRFEDKITAYIGSIRDYARMQSIFSIEKPKIVYHVAAYKHVPLMEQNLYEAIHTNIIGTRNIAQLSHEYQVQKMVFVSTDKAVEPSTVMGATKWFCEKYISALNEATSPSRFTFVRFGNVAMSNGSVIPLFIEQIENNLPFEVTDLQAERYFISIKDVSELLIDIIYLKTNYLLFAMGNPISIKKIINHLASKATIAPAYTVVGMRKGEKTQEKLLSEDEQTKATSHPDIAEILSDNQAVSLNILDEWVSLIEKNKWSLANELSKKQFSQVAHLLYVRDGIA